MVVSQVRGTKVQRTCQNKRCRQIFTARQADVDRGWAKFCCKSCKAVVQEKRTGQYADYIHGGVSKATRRHYAKEYGGIPEFNRNGDYVGFRLSLADMSIDKSEV